MNVAQQGSKPSQVNDFDAVIIGAGFAGMYMLHSLREAGFSAKVFEAAEDVGGVWYHNRYPGARCDTESIVYTYLFSEKLYNEWTWSSRYPDQPEILSYLNYVADNFNLRKDIQLNTRITAAHYDEDNENWRIYINDGTSVTAKYFIPAVGGLSAANVPNFKGLNNFKGEWYHTGKWPKEKVDFKGKRVGVIGTGSSGVQIIPIIAKEADHLTVFQRTPQYMIPARNHQLDPEYIRKTKANYEEIKQQVRNSATGDLRKPMNCSIFDVTKEERLQALEEAWEKGGFMPGYTDIFTNEKANETVAEFLRSKIPEIVRDPKTAEKLMPTYYYGTKRQVLNTDYLETYNRDNVSLIDVKKAPIEEITPEGLRTIEKEYDLDILVFATGYDAITGPLFKIDIRGKDGISLKEKWKNGGQISTYLGLATTGFPNLFLITGPESPAGFTNNVAVIESNVEWIIKCLKYLREHDLNIIEAEKEAEAGWSKSVVELANNTLFVKTESWWTGANIPGKPRGLPLYLGGFKKYLEICKEVVDKGYEGFSLFADKRNKVNSSN
ncbi:Predicted flavoprotein CzcO associated with the cation diffusion facilitator CzcD [Mesobacillus persicus]|uniref:Predicted flavoprotein CzcO associated with the cation diffusion facilitator CzcD n=1 Tax=Mesobacillus persicus TaxID=930146 RepID=A0A1H8D993_9BACI|nr:NAD(P)/FAD-dependent oxidoreductase [Mesobacillus persicus]SEN03715.1 Predicted flavoprotein CzcO associated with the cation diffusion facilitator CzcD [Mesobacillus persicus]